MKTLAEWLDWQETLHQSVIELGLERIRQVANRMGLLSVAVPVITVAGTNGKGSTCAMLTRILTLQGYRVGTYTSPHLLHYNERIALNGQPLADERICEAFAAIEAARGDISLTYFEFGTLAAVWCFLQANVDVMVLEIGLGGRLDAVNLWDADVAIITSIGIDHVEWLGSTREAIGREKAGIMRPGKPVICGDDDPPDSIGEEAERVNAILWQYGRDFTAEAVPELALLGAMQVRNAAVVIKTLQLLAIRLPVQTEVVKEGLHTATLTGRLQKITSNPDVIVDVSHNPHAVQELAAWLKAHPIHGKTHVIFSILADKDSAGVMKIMLPHVDAWHLVALQGPRTLPVEILEQKLRNVGLQVPVYTYGDFQTVWNFIRSSVPKQDRVVAFGSFLVVSGMLKVVTPPDH